MFDFRTGQLKLQKKTCLLIASTFVILAITILAVFLPLLLLPSATQQYLDSAGRPPPDPIPFMLVIGVWIVVFTGALLAIVSLEQKKLITARATFGIIGCIALISSFFGPYLSTDMYGYLSLGRAALVYHANPFVTPLSLLNDPVIEALPFYWGSFKSVYGPVLIAAAGFPSLLTDTRMGLTTILKAEFLIVYGALVYVTSRLLSFFKHPYPHSALFALWGNPVSLWLMLIDAHTEVLLVFFLLLSFLLSFQHKWFLSGLALGASIAVKIVPVILLPVFILYSLRGPRDDTLVLRQTARLLGGVLFSIVVLFAPWALGLSVRSFTEMLLSFYFPSGFGPVPLFVTWIFSLFLHDVLPPSDTFYSLVLPVIKTIRVLAVIAILCVMVIHRRKLYAESFIIKYSFLLVGAVLVTSHYLQPWYLLWVFPFAVLLSRTVKLLLSNVLIITVIAAAGMVGYGAEGLAMSVAAILSLPILLHMRTFVHAPSSTSLSLDPPSSRSARLRGTR